MRASERVRLMRRDDNNQNGLYFQKHNLRAQRGSKSAATRELEFELIQTQMAQKPMLRAEVGMRVRCANKASAE